MTGVLKRDHLIIFAGSISVLAVLLKPERCKFFMHWLCAHSGQAVPDSDLDQALDSLVAWFQTLSEADAFREYELIIVEIGWWRRLPEETLKRMMLDELGTH